MAESPAHPSPYLATLRECQDRSFEREGIPMYLTLVDEVAELPAGAGGRARSEGTAIAERMDGARASLLSAQRDGDMGALISVLQAVSYADLYPGLSSEAGGLGSVGGGPEAVQ